MPVVAAVELDDVVLPGARGDHQIDLYWEFSTAGILHRVAVECKDYNRNVSKERIAAFRAVLDDIGGIRGIYATKIGYQSGAKEFAKQHKIKAYLVMNTRADVVCAVDESEGEKT